MTRMLSFKIIKNLAASQDAVPDWERKIQTEGCVCVGRNVATAGKAATQGDKMLLIIWSVSLQGRTLCS